MFSFEVDRARRLLRQKLTGMWNAAIVDAYFAEYRAIVVREGWEDGNYVVLSDMREHGVQPKEATERGAEIVQMLIPIAPRRNAMLVGSALHGMQVSRIVDRKDQRTFRSEDEAMAWLME